MAISINWATKVIYVPQADLTPLGGSLYELNIDNFRLILKNLEDDELGMPFLRTHNHNTEVAIAGVTLARVVELINGYTVTFEDGQYAVNLVGANSNVADVTNVNQVSVRPQNSAGLTSQANPNNEVIDSNLSVKQILRLLLAVSVGKTTIVDNGGGSATVTFRDVDDTKDRLVADMQDSERLTVTLDPD